MTRSPRIDDPFAAGMQFDEPPIQNRLPAVQPKSETDQAMANIVTAQRVAIKRNLPDILRNAKTLAAAASQKFYYSIPFKERARDGKPERTVHIEGLSIDGAMAAASIYGNCRVEAFPANDTATHWTFMARFVDYETGFTLTKAFNQRKSQSTGMRDAERNLDIVFQIGQSKAIRNVVTSALKWLCDEMFLAAKSGVLERIQKNPEQARKWLVQQFELIEVNLNRVERIVTRPADRWLVTDMAKLFAELQSVKDGFADAEDLWPSDAAEALRREQAEERSSDKTLKSDAQHLDDVTSGQTRQTGVAGNTGADKKKAPADTLDGDAEHLANVTSAQQTALKANAQAERPEEEAREQQAQRPAEQTQREAQMPRKDQPAQQDAKPAQQTTRPAQQREADPADRPTTAAAQPARAETARQAEPQRRQERSQGDSTELEFE